MQLTFVDLEPEAFDALDFLFLALQRSLLEEVLLVERESIVAFSPLVEERIEVDVVLLVIVVNLAVANLSTAACSDFDLLNVLLSLIDACLVEVVATLEEKKLLDGRQSLLLFPSPRLFDLAAKLLLLLFQHLIDLFAAKLHGKIFIEEFYDLVPALNHHVYHVSVLLVEPL